MNTDIEAPNDTSEDGAERPRIIGCSLRMFLKVYGEDCFQDVASAFGGDEMACAYIKERFLFSHAGFAGFMKHYMFGGYGMKLDESDHPFLSEHIDYRGLAMARWRAGLLEVVPHAGTFLFFEAKRRCDD